MTLEPLAPLDPLGELRPSEERDPIARTLETARLRGVSDSARVLSELLSGCDISESVQRTDGGTVQIGSLASGFADVFDPWQILDGLFGSGGVDGLKVSVVRERASSPLGNIDDAVSSRPDAPWVVPVGRVMDALSQGFTVVLDGMDRRNRLLRRLSEHLARAFQCPVNINGYLSLRPDPGFGVHWDDHEVIIIQLLGRKHWKIHQPVTLSPTGTTHPVNEAGDLAWEGDLEPGMFVSIPRGWAHDVSGMDELTFHLTLTIPRRNISRVIRSSIEMNSSDARAVTLVDGGDPPLGFVLDSIRENFRGVIARDRASLAAVSCQIPSALFRALDQEAADPHLAVRSPLPGGGTRWRDEHGESVLFAGGGHFRVSDGYLSVLAELLDGRTRTVQEIEAASPEPATVVRSVVAGALRVGLLEVVDDPTTWGIVRAE
ncbi:MAG: hypothetical protein KDB02_04655 [Acidimicrobiales bacterium]|nr:hypothetical protein [Acidimicrobiales bacterium]